MRIKTPTRLVTRTRARQHTHTRTPTHRYAVYIAFTRQQFEKASQFYVTCTLSVLLHFAWTEAANISENSDWGLGLEPRPICHKCGARKWHWKGIFPL
jgi:hypothetical protein